MWRMAVMVMQDAWRNEHRDRDEAARALPRLVHDVEQDKVRPVWRDGRPWATKLRVAAPSRAGERASGSVQPTAPLLTAVPWPDAEGSVGRILPGQPDVPNVSYGSEALASERTRSRPRMGRAS